MKSKLRLFFARFFFRAEWKKVTSRAQLKNLQLELWPAWLRLITTSYHPMFWPHFLSWKLVNMLYHRIYWGYISANYVNFILTLLQTLGEVPNHPDANSKIDAEEDPALYQQSATTRGKLHFFSLRWRKLFLFLFSCCNFSHILSIFTFLIHFPMNWSISFT